MDTVQAFLDMGGYGGFVWPAFGITALVLAGLLIVSLRSLKAREATLAALQAGSSRSNARGNACEA
jgi:heme exporter protein D